jgi:hypothetical protein
MPYRDQEHAPLRRTEINPTGTAGPAALAIIALLIVAGFLFYNASGHGGADNTRASQQSSLQR